MISRTSSKRGIMRSYCSSLTQLKTIMRTVSIMLAVLVLLSVSGLLPAADRAYAGSSYITKKGFPKSYRTRLSKLHKQHPTWRFTPVITGLDWNQAVKKMTGDPKVNTIWYAYTPAYKSNAKGQYNYLTDTYSGGKFPAASVKAVKYFMDPRNFLTERNVFLFEDRKYHGYQKLAMVKKVLRRNEVLEKYAETFYKAGKKLNVSPLYLAAKSFSELGTSTSMMDGHKFKYKGVKYSKCYNAYNIGSTDTLGAVGGLLYANGGAVKKDYTAGKGTSYGRKWSTPGKAIRGGADFLSKSFIKNNQSTCYTEHFNVMNGIKAVGTHVYMTSLNGGISMAGQVSEKYDDFGIYEKNLVFYIPVYKNMPSKVCGRPSASDKKDNNCYLKKLQVNYKDSKGNTVKKAFIKSSKLNYRKTFKYEVPASVKTVTVTAVKASSTEAVVSGAGKAKLSKGSNVIKVKCKASAGPVRTYKITVIRK